MGETDMSAAAEHWEAELADPDAMHELGVRIGRALRAGDLLILTGPLGAGKTTLTRGIGEGLGVRGPITSPTFVVARTHPSLVGGPPLIHVDAYRLADAAELEDLDLDFAGSVVVAEWGAGLIDTRDSWLEVVIERPTGAVAGAGASAGAGESAGAVAEAATGSGAGLDADVDTEADTDWEQELIEPRIVRISGHGPRWREGVCDEHDG